MGIVTEEEIRKQYTGYINDATNVMEVKNNIISRVEINIIAHFGNSVSFELKGKLGGDILPTYNNMNNIGKVIRDFIVLFDLEREDGIELSTVRDLLIRCMYFNNTLIAIGHFMEDSWLYVDEWLSQNIEDWERK